MCSTFGIVKRKERVLIMNEDKSMLTIVVPCYNEEEVLPETVKELGGVLENMIAEYSNYYFDTGRKGKEYFPRR